MDVPTLNYLTDLADQAVILPLLVVTAIILWAQRRWRVAASWVLAVAGVLGTVLVLKVVCYACGWLWPALGPDYFALRSPSGHVASAAAAYGAIAALLAGGRPVAWSMAVALSTALAVAALIGMTRLQLGAHSLSEVVLAAGIGIAGAAAFAGFAGQRLAGRSNLPVMACALLVLVIFHGRHLPAEAAIRNAASETLRQWVEACQPDPMQDANPMQNSIEAQAR